MNDIITSRVAGAMIPITFGDCFGWLHPCPSGRAGSVAVLLCSGVSQDFGNGYRPFRLLADHLARADYPTLRFDYPGMGDSADPAGTNLWPAWCESVDQAVDKLRALTGAERVLLVGLRIGGLLAASAAAQRDDIAGLVLIEPCLTGRSYVSQLVTEARMRGGLQDAENTELGELNFSPACLAQMRAASLVELDLPHAFPVAIFSRMSSEKLADRLSSWQKREVWPDCHELGGLDALLRPSHHCGEAELAPRQLLTWLERVLPAYTPPWQYYLPIPELPAAHCRTVRRLCCGLPTVNTSQEYYAVLPPRMRRISPFSSAMLVAIRVTALRVSASNSRVRLRELVLLRFASISRGLVIASFTEIASISRAMSSPKTVPRISAPQLMPYRGSVTIVLLCMVFVQAHTMR